MRLTSRTTELIHLSLDARQATGVVLGLVAVLSVAFALGVSFGRRLSSAPPVTKAPVGLDALDKLATSAPAPTFAFEEMLQKSDPPPVVPPKPKPAPKPVAEVKPEPEPAVKPPPEPAVADKPPQTAPVLPSETKPALADKPAESMAEAFEKLAPPAPTPAVAKPAGGAWTVQFLASQERTDADRLASRLLGEGFAAYVAVADIPDKGTFYRVRTGPYATKEEAEGVLGKAAGRGHKGLVMPAR